MDRSFFPYILMFVMVISHTAVIMLLRKKRAALNAATAEDATRIKKISLAITILYIEIPVYAAIIWLVLTPALAQVR